MNILLNKDITGLNKDIIYNLSTKEYINTKFYNITIKDFLDLNNIKEYKNYREEYSELLNSLNIKASHVRWSYLLDEESIKSNFESLLSKINETKISDYESKVYPERLSLSNRIDKIYLGDDLPEYCHTKSVTGRTTISSGFNYLVSKKEERHSVQSRFNEGAILEIDIKSLEPRVYLKLAQDIEVEDVYDYIRDNVITKCNADRKQIKLAVISSLYGGSDKKVEKVSGIPTLQVAEIKKFLKVKETEQRIVSEFEEHGYFKNFYGRKIFSVKSPINYYVQSSSADFSCLIYEQFLKRIDPKRFNLVALIHDAIIIDVDKSYVDFFLSLKRLKEEYMDLYAPITVNILSKNYE
jgi:hypothetical protein